MAAGFLFLGFFTALAFCGNGENKGGGIGGAFSGGILGAILGTLLTAKQIKDAWKELHPKKEDEDNKEGDSKVNTKDDEFDDFDYGEEEEEQDTPELQRGRAIAMMQKQVQEADPDSGDGKKIKEQYDAMVSCMYDEDGKELSPEQVEENLKTLKKDNEQLFNAIQEGIAKSTEDSVLLEQYKKENSQITPGEAKAAFEQAKADRITIKKQKDIADLDAKIAQLDKNDKDYENKKKEFEDQKKAVNTLYDAKIKEHLDAAKKLKSQRNVGVKDDPEVVEAVQKFKDAQKRKNELGGKGGYDIVKKEYKDFKLGQFSVSDLTDDNLDPEKKNQLDNYLKENNIDKKTLVSYYAIQGAKDAKEREKLEKAFNSNISTQTQKLYDKACSDAEKYHKEAKTIIDKKKAAKTQNSGKPEPKQTEPTEPKQVQKVVTAVKNFEKQEGDQDWVPEIDEDGDPTGSFAVAVKKGEDGELKYVKRDKDGKETPSSKEEFENHKKAYNDFKEELNPEDEEKLDELLDVNHKESDDEKNSEEGQKAERDESGKRVNPAKVWHKKKNHQTGKMSKNYYNKSGASCTPQEYHDKIESYKSYVQRHKKPDGESVSMKDYLLNKLVVEEFYPNDMIDYLKKFF